MSRIFWVSALDEVGDVIMLGVGATGSFFLTILQVVLVRADERWRI